MCSVNSCVVGRYLLWLVCSLDKTVSFALFHFALQDQTCLFQVSPDFLLLHSIPLWLKGYLSRFFLLFFFFFFFFCFVWKIMIPLHHVGYVEKGRTLASLVAQTVNNLPAIQETWVQSLGRKSPCRREWWPILVFLPQEFHGQMSLAGCSPWDRKESDRTEQLTFFFFNSPPHFLYFHWYSALSLPLGIVRDLPSPHKRKSELTWSELAS